MSALKVAAIVGPTAAGKSEAAVDVARLMGAEIVSVDSMQIYRGMDAGTAKPSPEMRALVPHHLVDVVEPSHGLTVAEFQRLARAAVEDVAARGRLPLLVGGSGLYFRAVVDDLSFPPRSPGVRRALEAEAEELGPEVLHERLAELDPAAAARIEPANERRIVRALEVIEVTGRPFSENAVWDRFESIYELAVAGVAVERARLYERIERRVEDMLRAGLVGEVRSLADGGLGLTGSQALGYKQVLAAPDASEAELREHIVRATKRFARRQESWFRADPRVEWFEAGPSLVGRLVAYFRATLALP